MTMPLPRHWTLIGRQFPGVNYEFTSLSFYMTDGLVFLLLLTAIPRKRSPKSHAPLGWWVALMGGLVIWTAVSTTWTLDLSITAHLSIRLLLLLGMAQAIMDWRPGWRWVLWGLGTMVAVQTAVALTQFFQQDDLGLRWLGELDLNRYPGGGSILTLGNTYYLRAYGLTPHPNILGGFLAAGVLALTAAYLHPNRSLAGRLLLLTLIHLGGAALLLTFSRSAWLGTAVGGVFLLFFLVNKSKQRGIRPLLALIFSGSILLGGLAFSQRALFFSRTLPNANAFDNRAVNERAALNQFARDLLPLAPLTGLGAGVQNIAIIPQVAELAEVSPQPAHNVPLLLLAELGPVGSLLWLGLMLLPPAWTAVHIHRRPPPHSTAQLWLLGLAAALVALAVIDLFDYYMWGWPQGRLLRWLFWGLWGAAVQNHINHHPQL